MSILDDLLVALDKKRPQKFRSDLPNPYLEGNFAPIGRESDTSVLEVKQGAVPTDLSGTLYRMSPAPRFEPLNRSLYHWFDGDGMVDAFRLEGGRVSHKNRWVRTEKLAMEEAAGHALFGGIRDLGVSTRVEGWLAMGFSAPELVRMMVKGALGKGPSAEEVHRVLRVMDRSNTSIQQMGGHLLSLVDGSSAHEIDPVTLETRGKFDFDGALLPGQGGMVAHPKIDAATGAIYTFGYWGERGGLTYYVFDKHGKRLIARDFETPYAAMMHDFSVSETRAIFYHLPAVLHMGDIQNPNTIRWEPSRGGRIGVVLRDDPHAPIRWYEIPPCYIYHPMNAFDDGNAVVLDIVRYPRLPLFDPGGENPNAFFDEYPPGLLVRLRLDLETGKTTETILDDAPCEFPTVDPRYATRKHNIGFLAAKRGSTCRRGILNAIGRVDFAKGEVRYRELGRSTYTNEPIFVPRNKDAAEGDGYLLMTVHNADENASDLLILDAQELDKEPIATLRTRERVPYGFHGTWVQASG